MAPMKKIKAVMPSLREKKRYLAFEIVSKQKISGFKRVRDAISDGVKEYLGARGSSLAGVIVLHEKFDERKQRGLVRVGHNYMDHLRASFCLIDRIAGTDVVVRSLGASGVLRKAYEKYVVG